MIFEPSECVVIQHFAPEVGVISGAIIAAPDMREKTGTVTGRNIGNRQASFLQSLSFECVEILQRRAGRKRVPLYVELRGGQHLGQSVALIKSSRLLDFCR